MLCCFYVEQASLFVVRGFSSRLFSPALPRAPAAYLEIITNNHILTLFLAGLTQESRKLLPAVNKSQCNTFWFRDVQFDWLRRPAVGRPHGPADRLYHMCVSLQEFMHHDLSGKKGWSSAAEQCMWTALLWLIDLFLNWGRHCCTINLHAYVWVCPVFIFQQQN